MMHVTPPRALILDLGNVLIFHDNDKLYRDLAVASGTTPDAVIAALNSEAGRRMNITDGPPELVYEIVAPAIGFPGTVEEFAAIWNGIFRPNDAIVPMIEALHGRLPLVVLSNTNAMHMAHIRPVLPILERFDAVLTSHELGLVKPDAARLLQEELADPKYRCDIIAMGTNTDPYQPIEKDYRITRQILEVLSAHDHPVSIVTKSALILRDLDILSSMAERGLAAVGVSVTTLDRGLARRMEPRAATPTRRLEAIRALAEAGVPTAVMAAPMIPALNDMELERILEAAVGAGALAAGYVLLRLPLEIKDLFADWLAAHFPDRAARVLKMVRETRGGALYQAEFGERMRGDGPYAELIARRFDAACRKLGINAERRSAETDRRWRLDTARFRRPARRGDQLSLL